MKKFELRPYQTEIVLKTIRLLKRDKKAAIVAAVASGKTLMCKVIVEKMGFDRVVVATPFLNICKDFDSSEDTIYKFSKRHGPNNSITVKQSSSIFVDEKSTDSLKALIESNNTKLPVHIFSHHVLARLNGYIKGKQYDLSNMLIVIDEAHHCSDNKNDATKIGKFVAKAQRFGASVLYMTATPYRIFNDVPYSILPNECNSSVRTIGEQIREGFSPMIKIKYVKIGEGILIDKGKETISCNGNSHFSGNKAIDECKELLHERWVECEYPKSIIIIPPGNSVKSSSRLVKYFENIEFDDWVAEARGRKFPKVLNAVGMDKNEIIEHINQDKKNGGRDCDLVIACKRCDEGTDIPSASHIFCIGIPGNIRLINQRIGRILRNKKDVEGYTEFFGEWTEESVITYFLPSYGNIKDFDRQAANQLLHCILAGEEYEKYCNEIPFVERIKVFVKKKMMKSKKKDLVIDTLDNFISDAEFKKPFVEKKILVEVLKKGNVKIGEIPEILEQVDFEQDDVSVLVNVIDLIGLDDDEKDKFVEKISKKLIELPPSVNNVNEAVRKTFEEIIENFNDRHLKMDSSDKVNEISYKLTGNDMKRWCDDFFYKFDINKAAIELLNNINSGTSGVDPYLLGDSDD